MIGNKSFSPEENDVLLNRILQNYNTFTVKYSPKVAIVCIAEIFSRIHLPYVQSRFTMLFDVLLVLFEMYQDRSSLFDKASFTD